MKSIPTRHYGVPALILGLGITTGTWSDPALAMPAPQDGAGAQNQQGQVDRVDELLGEAFQLMNQARWEDALRVYESVLRIDPDNQEALTGRRDALARLDRTTDIQEVGQEQAVRQQQAIVEFEADVERARQLLEQNQFADALSVAEIARIELQQRREFLAPSEYAARLQTVETLINEIEIARERYLQVQGAQTQQEITRTQEEALLAEEQRRQEQIRQNLIRVRELQLQMEYDQALQVIDQILFLDENNAAALALRDAVLTAKLYVDMVRTERIREIGLGQTIQGTRESMVPPVRNIGGPGPQAVSDVMTYPEDWPAQSFRRVSDLGFLDTEANRVVAAKLDQTTMPIEFSDVTLEQSLAFLKEVTGVSIVPDWKALEFVGISPNDPVNLDLGNVTARTALDRVLAHVGDEFDRPEFAVQDGLLVVSSEDQIRKHTETVVHNIEDLLFEVPQFDNAPELRLGESLEGPPTPRAGFGGGFEGGNGGNGRIFTEPGEEPVRDSREQMVEQIVSIIQENIDPEGWRDLGGDTGSISELNGNLIITNTPRVQQEIEGLLSMLREIRALQINIESRFLTVSMDWFEKIGFDLDLYFNTDDDLLEAARAQDPLFRVSDFFDEDGNLLDPLLFRGPGQAGQGPVPYGNVFGFPIDTDGDGILDSFEYGLLGPATPIRDTQGVPPFSFEQESFNLVDTLGGFAADSFAGNVLAGGPAASIGLQFLDDVQVDLLIEATQADRRNVVLTAPRLTLFNGQRAWVFVGTRSAYIAGLAPIVGDDSGAFQPIPQQLIDGVVLDVEAVVSADRRYVTMTIVTSVTEVVDIESIGFTGGAGGGGDIDDPDDPAQGFFGVIQLPTVETAMVNTTVSVPDRGTVLLGGQRLVDETEVEVGVPVLSKIPYINRFFTNRVTSKTEETLLILVRPEIIIQQENEDILFPGLTDQISGAGTSTFGGF